jgi:hypothetical protein
VVRACIALSGRAGKGRRRAEGLDVETDGETDSYTADIILYVRTPVAIPLIEDRRTYCGRRGRRKNERYLFSAVEVCMAYISRPLNT